MNVSIEYRLRNRGFKPNFSREPKNERFFLQNKSKMGFVDKYQLSSFMGTPIDLFLAYAPDNHHRFTCKLITVKEGKV